MKTHVFMDALYTLLGSWELELGVDDRTVHRRRRLAVSPLVWSTACWLACGFRARRDPASPGLALLLAPNALASLRSIGLAETVIADGAIPARGEIRGRGGCSAAIPI